MLSEDFFPAFNSKVDGLQTNSSLFEGHAIKKVSTFEVFSILI